MVHRRLPVSCFVDILGGNPINSLSSIVGKGRDQGSRTLLGGGFRGTITQIHTEDAATSAATTSIIQWGFEAVTEHWSLGKTTTTPAGRESRARLCGLGRCYGTGVWPYREAESGAGMPCGRGAAISSCLS